MNLWCDGSSSLKSGRCAWAVVSDDGLRKSGGMPGTNQLAELEALRQAMLEVPEGSSATITTDSQYAIKGCTEWRQKWEREGWANYSGAQVKHKELWQSVHALYDKRKIKLVHVRGHTGNEMNELADALAGLQRARDESQAV